MPRLNEYEATKQIRSMENPSDAGIIPIIAMTANVFAEDIQASLDAGMNAHIETSCYGGSHQGYFSIY